MAISIGHPAARRFHVSGLAAAAAIVALMGASAGIAAVALDGGGGAALSRPATLQRSVGQGSAPESLTVVIVGSVQDKESFTAAQQAARNIQEAGAETLMLDSFQVLVVPPGDAQAWTALRDVQEVRLQEGLEFTVVDLR
ncbi:MAG TPA: hypothetical protein VNN10_09660 [Dehalococcoidia bacterium]|nr:hypothetical protein [Dehalococcoidia bacterium]